MPLSVLTPTTDNYLGTIANLHRPIFSKDLVLEHPGEMEFTFNEVLEMCGYWSPVQQTITSHQEKDWTWDTLGINANVGAPGAGNQISWVIPAAERANNVTYARNNDLVMFDNGVQGKIIQAADSTNAWTVIVEPLLTLGAIPALTAGNSVMVYSNMWGERTGQPGGRIANLTTINHTIQIIKEGFTVSGTELTNVSWVEVRGRNGKKMHAWYLTGEADTEFRFAKSTEMSMLLGGGQVTNAALAGDREMLGMIPFIEGAGGNIRNYTPGSFSLADFDSMIDLLDAQKLGRSKEYMMLNGLPFDRQVEDFIKDELQEGIRYATFDGFGNSQRSKEVAVSIGFKSFTRSGYTFHRKQFDEFTNPRRLGKAGMDYSTRGLLIPSGKTVDSQTGKKVAMCEMTYKELGGYSRRREVFFTGSAGVLSGPFRATNETDEQKINFRQEVGTRWKHNQAWGTFKV